MSEDAPQPKRRVSLTKKQLAEDQGAKLLSLLCEIAADGRLSEDEVKKLGDWLMENRALDYPCVGLLLEVLARVLADGIVSDDERLELHLAIERVLPVTERGQIRQSRETAEEEERQRWREERNAKAAESSESDSEHFGSSRFARRSGSWKDDPATDAQRRFIHSLGGALRAGATKGEASAIIDTKLGNQPLSNRQLMVLRFWNRSLKAGEDRRVIIDWLDDFYRTDPDRKLAWELFKQEAEDNGLQGDPNNVPLGIGPEYLARIKAGGGMAVPRFRAVSTPAQKKGTWSAIATDAKLGNWLVMLIILVVIVAKLISAYSK